MGNLSGVGAVLHEEELELLDVAHEELLETRGHKVTGPLVGAVSNLGHGDLALEPAADTVINTLGLTPRGVDLVVAIALMTSELCSPLLHNGDAIDGSDGHFGRFVLAREEGGEGMRESKGLGEGGIALKMDDEKRLG